MLFLVLPPVVLAAVLNAAVLPSLQFLDTQQVKNLQKLDQIKSNYQELKSAHSQRNFPYKVLTKIPSRGYSMICMDYLVLVPS